MKNFNFLRRAAAYFLFLSAAAFVIFPSPHLVRAANQSSGFEPNAVLEKIWVDYGVTRNNQKGMTIHISFKIFEMKDANCNLVIYFQDRTGTSLRDYNSKYFSSDGKVALSERLKPGFDVTVYEDLQLFMPYDEFDLLDGSYDLQMDVRLVYDNGTIIKNLTTYPFKYNQGAANITESSTAAKPTGTLNKVWVDYNVTENNLAGMRIHVNFSVSNMKGLDSYLALFFEKDGKRLISNDASFASKNGFVAAFYKMRPGFEPTVYKDAQLFIPYNEFGLVTGRHNLRMDIDLLGDDERFLMHLGFHSFWFDAG